MIKSGYRVAVIGGGPSGMAAAIRAAENGLDVTLYEKNSYLGKKLGITGKGRCNITNNCTSEEFLKEVVSNPKFLYSTAFRFPPSLVYSFIEELGVPLKTERGRRVFPVSDKASDIVKAFERRVRNIGVKVFLNSEVTGIERADDLFFVKIGNKKEEYSSVIICTGGLSYPLTGSTGDGYDFAESFGIGTTERYPSLVPVDTEEDLSDLSGLTLKNVSLSLLEGKKVVYSELGEMLFTHFGISGPLVLSASCHMRKKEFESFVFSIDLKPGIPYDELDSKIIGVLGESPTKDFINAISKTVPLKLLHLICSKAGIPERIKASAVNSEMRKRYVHTLKDLRLKPVSFRAYSEAVITAGGVETKELDPKTMESKKIPGLFFSGEVIDVDAYTGGYNLQIAISTGLCAAEGVSSYLKRTYDTNNK